MPDPARQPWIDLWTRLGARGDPDPVFRSLAARYSEPHRAYHTMAHVTHCLAEFGAARALARDPDAVELALWFHDAVYDPRATDCEEQSARLVLEVAHAAGIDGDRAAAMIRASTHRSAPDDPDTQLFADADLSILGQPEPVFDEYERGVRREYSFVPEPMFRAGRGAILRTFLQRPRLYGADFFRDRYESPARRNLERSLLRLA